ncbi:hypothetical protein [Bradyrhizobium sp.]|uniref:hypothetical protein n=1 Tax=Bradyrhizobium sp. TaxID=376 RepID=UPI0039E45DFA
MTDQADKHHAPRRYFVDAEGHRVLIGLSSEETSEFEALDGILALDTTTGRATDGAIRATRWLQIYEKHDAAWKTWIAQSRAEHARNSIFVNHD